MTTRTTTQQEGLHVDIRLRRGALDLDVALDVAAGETVAVVGPNGAGKSTLLHCIAGLLAPDDGTVRLAGQVLDDVGAGTRVPVARRRMGVVFPDHLLLPHLTASGNVAFGPRCHGASRRQADALARRWLDRVGLGEQADLRPGQLSGGQAQRVALARALATDPACVLLDEPLSALDVDTRGEVRRVLRAHLADLAGPALLVTHEPVEALALADRLVVLERGRVTQAGTAAEVARRPRSGWVARLVGVNLLSGTGEGTAVHLDDGGTVVVPDVPTGPVLATVHPRSISLHRGRPTGSPRNVWQGEVGEVEIVGDRVRVMVTGRPTVVAEVTAAAMTELDLAAGGPVWVSFKATDVEAYPR